MASASLLALLVLIAPMRKFLKNHPVVEAGFWILVVLIFLSYQIALATNIIFDKSPSKKIDVWVKQKVAYTGKGAHLTLLLNGPRIDYQRQILNVRPEVFDHVKLGDQISLSVHTGALGLLWFDGSWSKVPFDEKRP
ncbi:hypothetical protein F506_20210 [Herbaspirillum hiltneri N3]|uniref:Uncharacterized protein n=2 Tax=Herbaspirillum TaxID=963 RepID=A0ABN4I5A2_9BURK|nr:hypothetical protein F506_20210 [Herbaspirillum hiltneri N3]